MLSSQSDDEKVLFESIPLLGSSSIDEIPDIGAGAACCCMSNFSRSILRQLFSASFLSQTVLSSNSFRIKSRRIEKEVGAIFVLPVTLWLALLKCCCESKSPCSTCSQSYHQPKGGLLKFEGKT